MTLFARPCAPASFGIALVFVLAAGRGPAAFAAPTEPQATSLRSEPQAASGAAAREPAAPESLGSSESPLARLNWEQAGPPAPAKLSARRDAPPSERPFWKARDEARRRILNERAVLVSVNRNDLPEGRVAFSIRGAGVVDVPRPFAFKTAQSYEKLREISSHFREAKWEEKTGSLFVTVEALGYQARLIMKVRPAIEDWRDELQWRVGWGRLEGLRGAIGFEDAGPGRTEVSVIADLVADRLPLPRALMGFALEAIAQKVGERMRSFIEAAYAASNVDAKADAKAKEND